MVIEVVQIAMLAFDLELVVELVLVVLEVVSAVVEEPQLSLIHI